AAVIVAPGAGATISQLGGVVSATTVVVGDASAVPRPRQGARDPTRPSLTVTRQPPTPSSSPIPIPSDRREPSAGGGDPDGSAGGAGVLPRGIDRSPSVVKNSSVSQPGRLITRIVA